MVIKQCNFNKLRQYTKQKAKKVTSKPVKLMLVDKFSGKKKSDREVVARHYATWFVPNDKTKAPYSVRYKIEIKRDYYEKHRNKPDELRNCVIHELAHCKVPKTHGKDFKKVAKCLGADDNHARANWE